MPAHFITALPSRRVANGYSRVVAALRLLEPLVHETVVLGSRFIAYLAPVTTSEEALALLAVARTEHPDATHHCWAYRLGEEMRFSDDGEPGGTAGRPMLEVMLKRDIDRCAAVVVRYFGGRKLGAGGLVRAYSGAVARALDSGRVAEHVPLTRVRITAPFAVADAVLRVMGKLTPEFDASGLNVEATVESQLVEQLSEKLRDATRGSARLTVVGELPG